MDDLISRKALQLGLLNSTSFPSFYPFPNDRAVEKRMINFDYVMQIVKEQPTIEAEPVRHGRWDDDHKCTVCRKEALYEQKPDPYACGLLTLFYVDSTYCPNCGAKMDGGADDD